MYLVDDRKISEYVGQQKISVKSLKAFLPSLLKMKSTFTFLNTF